VPIILCRSSSGGRHEQKTSRLESFPGLVFVTIGSLDHSDPIEPMLEMFTKRRLEWVHALELPQFASMPA
jgi:hypothetical protein